MNSKSYKSINLLYYVKKMKAKIFKLIVFILGIFMPVTTVIWNELTLLIPTTNWQWDLNIQWPTSVSTDRTELIDIINIINKYLWFSIWLIAMAIFVYAGILLIVWWEKSNFEKANKMLLWAGVAIIVAILSYTIVNLLINLF